MSYIGNTQNNQNYAPAVDFFNGDGSTVAFTLSRPVFSVAMVQVVISNVPQNPGSAFTVSGSTITFTSAPPSGTANIYVYYTSPNTQVIQPGQGTVGTTQLADAAVTTAKLSSTTGTGAVALASLPSFTTTIGVGGATPAASGTGITFPATQSASSDANTLDDYEEGTWAPTFISSGWSFTYNYQNGWYVKIGKFVWLGGTVGLTNKSGSGTAAVALGNFPFAADAGQLNEISALTIGYTAGWVSAYPNSGYLSQGGTSVTLLQSTVSAGSTAINGGNLGTSGYLDFCICYRTST